MKMKFSLTFTSCLSYDKFANITGAMAELL